MLFTRDEYGRTGKPNGRFKKWQLNRFGFRSNEIELNKPSGVIRIACVGSSETFGFYEKAGREWPTQLSEILDSYRKGSYEVMNTAVPGRRLQNNIVHLRERVLRFKPDIVILIPFGLHYMSPDFKPRSIGSPRNVQIQTPQSNASLFSISSRFKPKIRECVKDFVPEALRKSIRRYEGLANLRKGRAKKKWEQFVDEISPVQLQWLRNDLEAFYNLCRTHDAKLILATVALHLSEENIIEAWRFFTYLSIKGFKEGDKKINQTFVEFAKEKQIPLVDLASIVPKDDLHMSDYIHFTDKGAEIVAQAFADAIHAIDL